MSLRLPEHRFWDFSLAVYGAPGVAETCLALQDEYAVNVNLLLYCCWVAADGKGRLAEQSLKRAVDIVAPWQHGVVRALRTVRRRLRDGFEGVPGEWSDDLRKRIGEVELRGEHVEQLILGMAGEALEPAPSSMEPREAAAANLEDYMALSDVALDERVTERLRTLLDAAFPAAAATDLRR
jgi:uncharacterized protein (TIGR02444 family)